MAMKNELPPIYSIRRLRVMLDNDLARLYGVTTSRFNEAVKRNANRFPVDFRFQLTREEYANLISQSATSSLETADKQPDVQNQSHDATSSRYGAGSGRGQSARRYIANKKDKLKTSIYR